MYASRMSDSNIIKQELCSAKTYEHNLIDESSLVDRHRCHCYCNWRTDSLELDYVKLASDM